MKADPDQRPRTALSPTERKRRERERLREQGLVPLEVWVPASKVERLRRYADKLRRSSLAD